MLKTIRKNIVSKQFALVLAATISGFLAMAQEGAIKGKVTEAETGESLPFVSIALEQNGKVIKGATADFNGDYTIKPIDSGTYDLRIKFIGYHSQLLKGIRIVPDSITMVDIEMKGNLDNIAEVLCMVERPKGKILKKKALRKSVKRSLPANPSSLIIIEDEEEMDYISYDVGLIEEDVYEHNTESYDAIVENNFKEVTNDPLSTFSVDVDRASYANVRRYINQNKKPPKDAVRIEELVNYFEYDYPQPINDDPFSINFETGECPWNRTHDLVMIGIQGKEVALDKIPPSNLVFLIDVSGSMDYANKLPLLKQAFKILVENLRPEDRVALVVYAGAAGVVLNSTPGTNKSKIIGALENLSAGGSTAGGEGIKLAYKIAKQNYIPKGNNRVILATDGDFNIGASSNAEMVELIEQKSDEGVFLSVLGFGMGNYKDSRMESISNAGNGNYAYIDNILEAEKVFGKEIWGTLYTIAKDVKIQVEFNPSKVKAYRLIGYENRVLNKEDFNDDKKDAGDIGSGHSVTALYEVIPAGSEEVVSNVDPLSYQKTSIIKSGNLMTVKLRYKKPDEEVSTKIVSTVKANDIRKKNLSENFMFAASVAEFGMLIRDSEHNFNASYEQALELAKASKGEDEDGYRQEFIKLVKSSQLLAK